MKKRKLRRLREEVKEEKREQKCRELPMESWAQICSFLSIEGRCRFTFVSKLCKKAQASPIAWKDVQLSVDLQCMGMYDLERICNNTHGAKFISSLHIDEVDSANEFQFRDFPELSNIRSLSLFSDKNLDICHLFKGAQEFPNLRSLEIEKASLETDSWTCLADLLPALTHLTVEESTPSPLRIVHDATFQMKRLTHLTLGGCRWILPFDLFAYKLPSKHFPALTHLSCEIFTMTDHVFWGAPAELKEASLLGSEGPATLKRVNLKVYTKSRPESSLEAFSRRVQDWKITCGIPEEVLRLSVMEKVYSSSDFTENSEGESSSESEYIDTDADEDALSDGEEEFSGDEEDYEF